VKGNHWLSMGMSWLFTNALLGLIQVASSLKDCYAGSRRVNDTAQV
jgi:hypothetical protein